MLKDVFTLKKDAWHAKLMKFTWGFTHRDFSHLCPYFWLSIVNVLFLPITLILKGFKKVMTGVDSVLSEMSKAADKRFHQLQEAMYEKFQKNPDMIKDFAKIDLERNKNYKYSYFVYSLLPHRMSDTEWLKLINSLDEERLKLKSKKYASKAKKAGNKAKINDLLRTLKPIAMFILGLISAFIVYYLVKFLIWLVISITKISIEAWICIGVIVGLIVLAFFLKFLGQLIRAKLKFSEESTISRGIKSSLRILFRILAWPFVKLYQGIVFLVEILKNSCPAIDWK